MASLRAMGALAVTGLVACSGGGPVVVTDDRVFTLDETRPEQSYALGLRLDGAEPDAVIASLTIDLSVLTRAPGADVGIGLFEGEAFLIDTTDVGDGRTGLRLSLDCLFCPAGPDGVRDLDLRLRHSGTGAVDGRLTLNVRVEADEDVEVSLTVEADP